jgi:hypothetical protein
LVAAQGTASATTYLGKKMAREIEAGKAFVELSVKDKLVQGLLKAKLHLQNFGSSVSRLAGLLSTVGTNLAAFATTISPMKVASEQTSRLTLLIDGVVGALKKWAASYPAVIGKIKTTGETFTTVGAKILELVPKFSSLTSALLSPMGAALGIVGIIGVAGAAWIKFTDTGRAAAKAVMDAFAPVLTFIRDTVGGIGNALIASNIPLAGQIVVNSLKIIFGEGANTIADLIGGNIGNAIGEIATQLASGNLIKAWQTTVQTMGAIWAEFSQGIVKVFASATNAIIDKWQKSVRSIANGMLRMSAEGGVAGWAANLFIGRDVRQLQAENDRIDAERGIKQDIFGIGAASIADSTDAIAGPIQDFFERIKEAAKDNADAAENDLKGHLAGRGGAHRVDIGSLEEERRKLLEQAAKERAGVVKGPGAALAERVAVGFSGSSLAAQLAGGAENTNKRIARAAEEALKKHDAEIGLLHGLKDALKGLFAIKP